jgi:hypothetical protein
VVLGGAQTANIPGWVKIFRKWLLTLYSSIAIVAFIARSKLVPDFAITVHFLHLVIASLYSGHIPRHGAWWFTMLASSAVCVGLGTWGCQYRELQPVFFGGRPILPATGSEGAAVQQPPAGDEEMGIAARGRGADGGGEYEMAPMHPVR